MAWQGAMQCSEKDCGLLDRVGRAEHFSWTQTHKSVVDEAEFPCSVCGSSSTTWIINPKLNEANLKSL